MQGPVMVIRVTGDDDARRELAAVLSACDRAQALVAPREGEARLLVATRQRRSVNRARRRVRDQHRREAEQRHLHLWARCRFGDRVVMAMDVGRSESTSVRVAEGGRRGLPESIDARWHALRAMWLRGTIRLPPDPPALWHELHGLPAPFAPTASRAGMLSADVHAAAEAQRVMDPRAHVLARTSTMSAEDVSATLAGVTLRVSSRAEGVPLATRCAWARALGHVLLVTAEESEAIHEAALRRGRGCWRSCTRTWRSGRRERRVDDEGEDRNPRGGSERGVGRLRGVPRARPAARYGAGMPATRLPEVRRALGRRSCARGVRRARSIPHRGGRGLPPLRAALGAARVACGVPGAPARARTGGGSGADHGVAPA